MIKSWVSLLIMLSYTKLVDVLSLAILSYAVLSYAVHHWYFVLVLALFMNALTEILSNFNIALSFGDSLELISLLITSPLFVLHSYIKAPSHDHEHPDQDEIQSNRMTMRMKVRERTMMRASMRKKQR